MYTLTKYIHGGMYTDLDWVMLKILNSMPLDPFGIGSRQNRGFGS